MVSHIFTRICLDICLFFCVLYGSGHSEGSTLHPYVDRANVQCSASSLSPSALHCPSLQTQRDNNKEISLGTHLNHTSLEIVPIDHLAVTASDLYLYITYSYSFTAETKIKYIGFTRHVLRNRARARYGGGEAHPRLSYHVSGHS